MIKIGIICPTAHLNDFAAQSNFHLVLPHIIKESPNYAQFYIERAAINEFVVLDNGIFELDEPFSNEELLDMVENCGFDEVVAPETVNDSEKSQKQLEDFLNCRERMGSKKPVLAMVQSKSFLGMLEYANYLNSIKEVSTLGVPFRLEDVVGFHDMEDGLYSPTLRRVIMRWKLMDAMNASFAPQFVRGYEVKPFHLMGLSDPLELQRYKGGKLYDKGITIRYNDSSSAYVHGSQGIMFNEKGLPREKLFTKLNFDERIINWSYDIEGHSVSAENIITQNIQMLKKFAGYGSDN